MTKNLLFIFLIFLGTVHSSYAQPASKQRSQKITLDDLKPRINYSDSEPFYEPLQQKKGLALASSAIIPGSGQAANGKWIRAGAYFLAELILVGVHIKSYHDAKVEHQRYKQFANNNWSVVTYAKWLVDYHEQNNLNNQYIEQLKKEVEGTSAAYNPQEDWQKVDIELLRNVERNTPFVYPDAIGNNFSHVMPDYGSQQYYELISKYYQYGVGWNDFGKNKNGNNIDNRYKLSWDGSDMPFNFIQGANLAEDFNDSYRLAGNMVSLIILNHVISAFDAFLTVKINKNRLEAETNFLSPQSTFSLKYHF